MRLASARDACMTGCSANVDPPRDRGDGCRVGLIIGMAVLQAMQDEALEKSLGTPCRQVSLSPR